VGCFNIRFISTQHGIMCVRKPVVSTHPGISPVHGKSRWWRILWANKTSPLIAVTIALSFGATVGAASPRIAYADETQPAPVDAWVITLGGGAEYGPSFEGSKKHSVLPTASFDFRRLDEPEEFSATDDNIDYTVLDLGGLEIGPVVGIRDGRSAKDDLRLGGLHDVNWNMDTGVFLQYWPIEKSLRVRSETRQALWGGDGLIEDLSADWVHPVTEDLVVSAGPRVSLGNGVYMRNNFGVSSTDAARSPRFKSYDAEGGLKSVGLAMAAEYKFSPTWSGQAYARYERLVGAAGDSPIISGIGTRNQTVIGLTISHSFNLSF
jgi:outer membrane protein